MALGRQGAVQRELLIGWHEVPSAPGHIFYDRLNAVLEQAGFDREVEALCAPHYAAKVGRPSVPPGRYFRMLLVGYVEGLDSERGIAWRCADSLSLRQFLQLGPSEAVPDHSTLSRSRARLPLEVHDAVFALVLGLVAAHGLVKGRRVGVDASTMAANAAMRSIVRREDGAGWPAMLGELARASGVATPTAAQLRQLDRTRAGKRVANAAWASPTDPEARITRLKDGRTRLAYKPEHAVDLDTGAILAAPVHPGDAGDTQTLEATLEVAGSNLATLDLAPAPEDPAEVVADKGYHARGVLKRLADGAWQTRIAEPARRSVLRWHGDAEARRAVYANRARLLSGVARVALLLRAVLCERAFAHVLDRGGMRRTWLRGRDNVAKRYLVHVAGHNLGLLMRALFGAGTPKAAADLRLFWLAAGDRLILVLLVGPMPASTGAGPTPTCNGAPGSLAPAAIAVVTLAPDERPLSTGC
jgi:transposase